MERAITNILVTNVDDSADYYAKLLGMTRHFDSDWYVVLVHDALPNLEFGILRRDHEIVPDAARASPRGMIMTFVVADVDAVHATAQSMGAEILEPPTNQFYGQRRMVLRDPDGTIVDVSSRQ